ncbi:hypothetical protein [Sandarakinorhabdus sp.]|uniref:hypothetical protein n=1 Tax=Sandarakinorhabdus sp. TaxID=1916663 RepID=UPI00286E885A|nr:hypothetical protein [Sandarakinorhabdus sp.]
MRLPELLASPQMVFVEPDGRHAVWMTEDGRDYLAVIDVAGMLGGPVVSVVVSTHSEARSDSARRAVREGRVTYASEDGRRRWVEQVPTRTGESSTADTAEIAPDGENVKPARPILTVKRSLDQSARGAVDLLAGRAGAIIRLFDGRDLSTVLHDLPFRRRRVLPHGHVETDEAGTKPLLSGFRSQTMTLCIKTAAVSLGLASLLVLASTAVAEPVTSTKTIDNAKISGTIVTTRDPDTRTQTRDAEVTRKSDGAVAVSSATRTRTDDGVTASGSRTGFDGKTSSFDYTRTRTETGYAETGTRTGKNGQTLTLDGSGTRTADGAARSRSLTNGAGEVVASRDVTVSRANGQVTRNVQTVRPEGARANRAAAGRANRPGRAMGRRPG